MNGYIPENLELFNEKLKKNMKDLGCDTARLKPIPEHMMKTMMEADGKNTSMSSAQTSSAAQCLNYFLMLNDLTPLEEFCPEFRIGWPLEPKEEYKKTGKYQVNYDAVYRKGDELFIYEWKFLEPYRNNPSTLTDSYTNENCYKDNCKNAIGFLIPFMEKSATYLRYNAVQMAKHLLALYSNRDPKVLVPTHDEPSILEGINKVHLINLSWEPTEQFISMYDEDVQAYIRERKSLLQSEEETFIQETNELVAKLDFGFEVNVETKHLNDDEVLGAIKEHPLFETFKKLYLL